MRQLFNSELCSVSGGMCLGAAKLSSKRNVYIISMTPHHQNSIGPMQVVFDGCYVVGIEDGYLRSYLINNSGVIMSESDNLLDFY